MIGMKQFCALILAGGMGAGSVVTVQHTRPSISKARAAPAKPKVQKSVQRNVQTAQLTDCPTIAPLGPGIGDLAPLQQVQPLLGQPIAGVSGPAGISGPAGGFGGGGFGREVQPAPIPVVPGVPQPDSWVMLVAGFGFMGLALRRRKSRSPTQVQAAASPIGPARPDML